MTDEKVMDLINNMPVTREEFDKIIKTICELMYVVHKVTNPPKDVLDEAAKFSEKLAQDKKDKDIELYKKQLDELGFQDIFNKFF